MRTVFLEWRRIREFRERPRLRWEDPIRKNAKVLGKEAGHRLCAGEN